MLPCQDRALQQHLDVAHLARQLAAEKAIVESQQSNAAFHGISHREMMVLLWYNGGLMMVL